MAHPGGVLGANLETARVEADELFLKVVGGVEGVVSDVDVSWEGKGELPMCEELGGYYS